MKLGDKIVCIRECRMNQDWNDKRTTIGKTYTIVTGHFTTINMSNEENWCIIDDIGNDHYFTDNWNKYFRPVRKAKLMKINELSDENR